MPRIYVTGPLRLVPMNDVRYLIKGAYILILGIQILVRTVRNFHSPSRPPSFLQMESLLPPTLPVGWYR